MICGCLTIVGGKTVPIGATARVAVPWVCVHFHPSMLAAAARRLRCSLMLLHCISLPRSLSPATVASERGWCVNCFPSSKQKNFSWLIWGHQVAIQCSTLAVLNVKKLGNKIIVLSIFPGGSHAANAMAPKFFTPPHELVAVRVCAGFCQAAD